MSQVKGKVRRSTINHYKDCTADTYIELEDGEKVLYSHVAPVPTGHDISATGVQKTFAEVMAELHSNFFRLEEGKLVSVIPVISGQLEVWFDPQTTVLKADQVEDQQGGITYRERY